MWSRRHDEGTEHIYLIENTPGAAAIPPGKVKNMTRTIMTLDQIRNATDNDDFSVGICGLVDVEDMGFCFDGVTRYYLFELDGIPCIYFKH